MNVLMQIEIEEPDHEMKDHQKTQKTRNVCSWRRRAVSILECGETNFISPYTK